MSVIVTDGCQYIPETKYVMAGWACCHCRVYNGVWRVKCKSCGHVCCVVIPQDVINRQNAIREKLGYAEDGKYAV